MEYTITPPPTPTFARWRRLYRGHHGLSCLRALEYEAIGQLEITGQVLDYGGGQAAQPNRLLARADDVMSANIDPKMSPTHIVEPDEPLPFAQGAFDYVVSFNTLEHIYDPYAAMEEIFRVLKPSGLAIIAVPWIFRVHGHPDDYTRATPSWWQETCRRIGFSALELQPLVWGRYTAAGSILGYRGLWPRGQFHLQHFKDWLYAKTVVRRPKYSGRRGRQVCNVAPGWLLKASK